MPDSLELEEQLNLAVDYAALRFAQSLQDEIRTELFPPSDCELAIKTESPIEQVFAVWFLAVRKVHSSGEDFWLDPQIEVKCEDITYRLDFCICLMDADLAFAAYCHDLSLPKVAIELDGHDFHEKTKEQVDHRNRRDRELQRNGWIVFHFSGRELLQKPVRCCEEVLDAAQGQYAALQRILRDRGIYPPRYHGTDQESQAGGHAAPESRSAV